MSRADWVSWEEARARILASVATPGQERVPIDDALGRALAHPLDSPVAHPPWDNSAMDGFAVRASEVAGASSDRPVTLPVSDDIPAGGFPSGPLRPGTAARIMTGAPVPEGATGVIRVEHTDGGDGDRVTIREDSDRERHIRRRGEDIPAGGRLLDAGEEIGPAAIALLALAGRTDVEVGRRPRVGVLANGDELAGPDDYAEVRTGRKIANSNGPALAAQLRDAGAVPVDLGIARDDPGHLRERLEAGADCDAIISAAGVSVGEHDHVKAVLDELGFERHFWRVKMRPGSATLYGLLDGRPLWGVPGNPVSAMVAFETLVRPAVRRMAGFARILRRPVQCVLAEELRGPADVTSFLRVLVTDRATGRPEARPTGPQGSGILTSMLADGLAVLPLGVDRVPPGGRTGVIPLREWTAAAG
ncbi:MAG: molybdopterin molybdotransferase MoeA [Gemmatimonadota bacterium]|nr:molybdopterin molybdotransferase MoeA [Gemmatimonadota bacterium]